MTKPNAPAPGGAPEKPKRTIDERVRVLRVADKVAALDEQERREVSAFLAPPAADATRPDYAKAAERLDARAAILRDVSRLSETGLATLRKLVAS